MAAATFIYDADRVLCLMANVPIDSGFADGEFVKIERDAERFSYYVGTDGQVTRSKNLNKVHKITLRLAQSSASNDRLSTLINLDDNSPNGAGVGAFLVQDLSGRALFAGSKSWIHKDPDVSFDRMAKEREWTIIVADMQRFDGGNFQV